MLLVMHYIVFKVKQRGYANFSKSWLYTLSSSLDLHFHLVFFSSIDFRSVDSVIQ